MGKIITLDVLKRYNFQKKVEFPKGTLVTAEAKTWAKAQGMELFIGDECLCLPDSNDYQQEQISKVVVSVIGLDKVGIIAGVSETFAKYSVNILDISQTTLQGLFVMVTVVDIAKCIISFEQLKEKLEQKGEELGVKIDAMEQNYKYLYN